jgi:hypothetical protein
MGKNHIFSRKEMPVYSVNFSHNTSCDHRRRNIKRRHRISWKSPVCKFHILNHPTNIFSIWGATWLRTPTTCWFFYFSVFTPRSLLKHGLCYVFWSSQDGYWSGDSFVSFQHHAGWETNTDSWKNFAFIIRVEKLLPGRCWRNYGKKWVYYVRRLQGMWPVTDTEMWQFTYIDLGQLSTCTTLRKTAASPFKASVSIYWSRRLHVPEDSTFHQHRCENLISAYVWSV